MNGNAGRILLIVGICIALAGAFLIWKDSIPFLKHLGRLPGDIRIERPHFSFYFPLVTGLILSIVLTLIINLISRLK